MTGALLGWRWWWLTGRRFRRLVQAGPEVAGCVLRKAGLLQGAAGHGRSAAGSNLQSRFAVERKKTVKGKAKHLTGCLSPHAQPQNQAKECCCYKIKKVVHCHLVAKEMNCCLSDCYFLTYFVLCCTACGKRGWCRASCLWKWLHWPLKGTKVRK